MQNDDAYSVMSVATIVFTSYNKFHTMLCMHFLLIEVSTCNKGIEKPMKALKQAVIIGKQRQHLQGSRNSRQELAAQYCVIA